MKKRYENMWWNKNKKRRKKEQGGKLDYLLDLLQDLGFVKGRQVATARKKTKASGIGVVDWLLANKIIRPADIAQAMAANYGLEMVLLNETKISDEIIACVPGVVARKNRIIPIRKHNGELTIAIANPSDLATIDSLTHVLNVEIFLKVASDEDINAALAKYYGERRSGK